MFRRAPAWFVLTALVVPACDLADTEPATVPRTTEDDGPSERDSGRVQAPVDPPIPFVVEDEPCRHDGLEDAATVSIDSDDVAQLSYLVARRTHRCAAIAVIAPVDTWAATLAVPVALSVDAPLLLLDPDDAGDRRSLGHHLDALEVRSVITVGLGLDDLPRRGTALNVPDEDGVRHDGTDGEPSPPGQDDASGPAIAADPLDRATAAVRDRDHDVALALLVADHLTVDRFVAVREDDVRGRTAAALRTDGSTALLPVPSEPTRIAALAEALPTSARLTVVPGTGGRGLADELLSVGIDAALIDGDRWRPGDDTSWLVDPDQPEAGALAAVAAGGRGEAVLPIDATDLRAGVAVITRIRAAAPERVVLLGEITSEASWQLPLVLDGAALPGGGLRLFEDERLVALYGSPLHPALGALGEQDLDATVERLREAVTGYDADGMRVLPGFEIITTVASTSAGEFGDYSTRTDIETLEPYVERAADEGFYVILDLQPGRTDFLAQAEEYEELLRHPHVGLALDPEWRIGPDERHLERIGSVEVEEVQRVADWLAALTREHQLPQKLLLLHQFTDGMLPDRDELVAPQELAVVIHMDGQGPLQTKYDTYRAVTRGAEDRWTWGWKNFYDEDDPVATPDQVLELDPPAMLVTYQ